MSADKHQYEYGTEIPIEEPVSRIVSLVPSLTESLFDINLGDRVVGITDYCTRPEDAVSRLPRVGGTKTPDLERIFALRPELVFASQEENTEETVTTLRKAGIPVWVTHPKTVPDVFNMLWDIMNVFDQTLMVPRIRLIEHSYDWVTASVKARSEAPCCVFLPVWNNPLMTISADTYTHDLLAACGGRNVFADAPTQDSRYPQVTMEDVIAAQPEVILLPSEPYAFTESDRARFAALDVPAAHNQRIHLVDGALLTWPGTRVAYALTELPLLLMPVGSGNAEPLKKDRK